MIKSIFSTIWPSTRLESIRDRELQVSIVKLVWGRFRSGCKYWLVPNSPRLWMTSNGICHPLKQKMWNHETVEGLFIYFFKALCFILQYYIILNSCSKFEWSTCHMIFFYYERKHFLKTAIDFFQDFKTERSFCFFLLTFLKLYTSLWIRVFEIYLSLSSLSNLLELRKLSFYSVISVTIIS